MKKDGHRMPTTWHRKACERNSTTRNAASPEPSDIDALVQEAILMLPRACVTIRSADDLDKIGYPKGYGALASAAAACKSLVRVHRYDDHLWVATRSFREVGIQLSAYEEGRRFTEIGKEIDCYLGELVAAGIRKGKKSINHPNSYGGRGRLNLTAEAREALEFTCDDLMRMYYETPVGERQYHAMPPRAQAAVAERYLAVNPPVRQKQQSNEQAA